MAPAANKKFRVLIVDDSAFMRKVLEQIFNDLGYEGTEAHIRARVSYYHQVGYYAMGVQESRKERRALIPYYRKVLTGRDA